MLKKVHIKAGDQVKVIAGEDKGKEGKVISVDREKNRAVVEGVNIVSKHVKPSAANPQGGIEKREASVHASNLMLVVDGQTTRIGRKEENGRKVRFAKKTGEVIS